MKGSSKNFSYARRDYESVDDKSLSKSMTRIQTKKKRIFAAEG